MLKGFFWFCLFVFNNCRIFFKICAALPEDEITSRSFLWDPVERSSRISSPGCRHYKLNPNREFISQKMLSGIFFKLLLFKEGNKKLSCCFFSFFRIQFVFFSFTHHHASLNHPPSDEPSCCIMLLWQTLQSLSVASCDVVLNQ